MTAPLSLEEALEGLTPKEREAVQALLLKKDYSVADALNAIGRSDLIEGRT